MPLILARMLHRLTTVTWATPIALIASVFAISWALMIAAEPGSALVKPENYWWWFIVTASTVGYGDFFPQTTAGHLVGVFVIAGGIATLTTLFARLAAAIDNAKGRRMTGAATINATGHTVVIGYTAGRTERVIGEVLADEPNRELVLCAPADIATHPAPQLQVAFIRGSLADEDTLRRAGVHRAGHILIDAADDNEALAILVTVAHLNAAANIVVALHDLDRATQLSYVHSRVHCVLWHHPRMLAEELQDPGITRIYTELMTHGGGNTYSMVLPSTIDHLTAGSCQVQLSKEHGATLLGFDHDGQLHVSPPWSQPIPGGATIYYIARGRLSPAQLQPTATPTFSS